MPNTPEGMITLDKFAKRNELHENDVIEKIREGILVGRKVGDQWFVDPSIDELNFRETVLRRKKIGCGKSPDMVPNENGSKTNFKTVIFIFLCIFLLGGGILISSANEEHRPITVLFENGETKDLETFGKNVLTKVNRILIKADSKANGEVFNKSGDLNLTNVDIYESAQIECIGIIASNMSMYDLEKIGLPKDFWIKDPLHFWRFIRWCKFLQNRLNPQK